MVDIKPRLQEHKKLIGAFLPRAKVFLCRVPEVWPWVMKLSVLMSSQPCPADPPHSGTKHLFLPAQPPRPLPLAWAIRTYSPPHTHKRKLRGKVEKDFLKVTWLVEVETGQIQICPTKPRTFSTQFPCTFVCPDLVVFWLSIHLHHLHSYYNPVRWVI